MALTASSSCRRVSRTSISTPGSVARHRAGEDLHKGARHLDADGPHDDPLDPLLRLEHGPGLGGDHLPQEGEDEGEGADGPDQRLAGEDPAVKDVLDRLDGLRCHVRRPPGVMWRIRPGTRYAAIPGMGTEAVNTVPFGECEERKRPAPRR